MHSPLFVKLSTSILCEKPTQDLRTRRIVSSKRIKVRTRAPRRVVFNELDNIYVPKKYNAKMMSAQAAFDKGAEWSENLNMTLMCKDCKEFPPNLVEEFSSGDMVCGSCGLVLGDRIVDTRSEWRTFSNDDQGNDDPSRVGDGANPLLNGSQLQTTIAFGDGNARSRDLLRTQGKSSVDKATKGLLAAYKEIGAHCDAVSIPKNVSDTAKHLYKLVDDAKAFKGKSQEAIIAGCIFIACRQCGVPRTFREIYALTKVSKKDIGRTFKALEKFFAAESATKVGTSAGNGLSSPEYQTTTSTNAKDLCLRYCSQLGLNNQQFVKVSQGLADKMSTVGDLAGRSPLSVAAACIYMASYLLGKPKSPKEISQVAGVSDGTIRTAYKYLYQDRERLIEPEWIADGKGKMENLPVG
jgi:transcription initiation factor TFIIB